MAISAFVVTGNRTRHVVERSGARRTIAPTSAMIAKTRVRGVPSRNVTESWSTNTPALPFGGFPAHAATRVDTRSAVDPSQLRRVAWLTESSPLEV